jgi:hypothetical protein
LSPAAIADAGPVNLAGSTRVQARVFFDAAGTADDWSPLVDKTFVAPGSFPLRIVELNYNPAPQAGIADEQDLEFLELLNTGSSPISLDGVQIAGFASAPYSLASGLVLGAGERIIVARNPSVFTAVYGAGVNVAPGGYGTANLSNGGESVLLVGPAGETIQSITYSDDAPWPAAADGGGHSLEIIDPLGDADDPANWRASYLVGGSPGAEGLPPATPGDFDGDDDADGADFLAWQRGLGRTDAVRADGDADGDQDVDGADLALWGANFGPAPPVIALSASSEAPTGRDLVGESVFAEANAWLVAPDESDVAEERLERSVARRRAADEVFAQWKPVRHAAMPWSGEWDNWAERRPGSATRAEMSSDQDAKPAEYELTSDLFAGDLGQPR